MVKELDLPWWDVNGFVYKFDDNWRYIARIATADHYQWLRRSTNRVDKWITEGRLDYGTRLWNGFLLVEVPAGILQRGDAWPK